MGPWSAEAEKLLLDWLDENKGAALLEGVDGFLAQHRKDFPGVAMDESKVKGKLKRFFEKWQIKFTQEEFHEKGSVVLDWNQLEERFGSLYSPDVLAARKETTNRIRSPSYRDTLKRMADAHDKEHDADEASSDGQHENSAVTNETTRPAPPTAAVGSSNPAKRQKVHHEAASHQSPQQADAPSAQSTANSEKDAAAATSMGQSSQQAPSAPTTATGKDRVDISTAGDTATSTASSGAPQENILSGLNPKELPKLRALMEKQVPDKADHLGIQIEMVKIHEDIDKIVSQYLQKSEVADYQPVNLDPKLAYPPDLNRLLGVVLGGEVVELARRRDRFTAFQRVKNVGYSLFFQALIACAITEWCFQIDALPTEERFFKSIGDGIVEKAFKNALEPVVEARLRERIWEVYIDETLLSRVRSKAELLARQMTTFVDLLLPRMSTDLPEVSDYDVVTCPVTEPLPQATTFTSSLFGEQTKCTDREHFQSRLTDLFAKALEWRAKRHKSHHEEFFFHFPAFEDAYQSELKHMDRDLPEYGQYDRVILGLMPVVRRRMRTNVLGNFGTSLRVAYGVVI